MKLPLNIVILCFSLILGACSYDDSPNLKNNGGFNTQKPSGFPKVTGAANNKSFDISQTALAGQHQILQMKNLIEHALNPEETALTPSCVFSDSIQTQKISQNEYLKIWTVSYRNCIYGDKKSTYKNTMLYGLVTFEVIYNELNQVQTIKIRADKNRYAVKVRNSQPAKSNKRPIREWAEVYNDIELIAQKVPDAQVPTFNVSYHSEFDWVQKTKNYMENEGKFFLDISGQISVNPMTQQLLEIGKPQAGLNIRFFREGGREFRSSDRKQRNRRIFYKVMGEFNYENGLTFNTHADSHCPNLSGFARFAVNVDRNFLRGDISLSQGQLKVKNNMKAKWFKGKEEVQTSLPSVCSLGNGFYPGYFLFD